MGTFNSTTGALNIDGHGILVRNLAKGGSSLENGTVAYRRERTYAHELGHALDRGYIHSSSPGWRAAADKEINLPHSPLCKYAKTSYQEAFAEFYSLVIHNPKVAQTKFPKCWAEMKGYGYV
jgi:hypothetical protein